MKSYFSIIYATIRADIQEKIAIGLILVGENSIYYKASDRKLHLIKEFISDEAYLFIKHTSSSINKKISSIKSEVSLFNVENIENLPFEQKYIDYLSVYSNNVVSYSKPNVIELPCSEELFNSIYCKYIDSIPIQTHEQTDFQKVLNDFYPKVSKFYNSKIEVDSSILSGIIYPIKIDLLGVNEIPVFAQAISFDKPKTYNIEKHISDVFMLKNSFNIQNKKSKSFIISAEPDKNRFAKQHQLWINMRESNIAEVIDIAEVEKIEVYAKEHGVKPYLEVVE